MAPKKGEIAGLDRKDVGFDATYCSETPPPWDIGRPQWAFVKLAETGAIRGKTIDVGCGTGENALFLARTGLKVLGVDSSPTAIGRAEEKAKERNLPARFQVADALHLETLGETFDSAIDCGLFHVFDDDNRALYVESLRAVLKPGGKLFLLCFSEFEPGDWGPRRVTQAELRRAFGIGWKFSEIRKATFETLFDEPDVHGWLAVIARL